MKKEIYLIKEVGNETYQQFSNRILSLAASVSNDNNVVQLKVVLTSVSPAKISVIPFKKKNCGHFRFFCNNREIQSADK